MLTIVERTIGGRKLSIETGELAKQANGSVIVRYNETIILVTAVISSKPREGLDFFPLVVDFEEKLYAAGKIPGGFIKREGKPSEKSILTSRLIDRPIRPLFPEGLRNEVQIVGMTLSSDMENDADIPALNGASAALSISDIPIEDTIGAVRIGMINNEFVINPTFAQLNESALNLVVAGTREKVLMIESGADEVDEKTILEAIKTAHENIKVIIDMIEELRTKCAKPKTQFPLDIPDKDLEFTIRKHFTSRIHDAMKINDKKERSKAMENINKSAVAEILSEHMGEHKDRLLSILTEDKSNDFNDILKKIEEEELRKMIVNENIRPDGRKIDEIRKIDCKVSVLPRTHGSGLFTRGQTQVLSIATLGAVSDEQILDDLSGLSSKRYMHQYNFPPFSVGETKPMRGPGRREIGHGALAEKALIKMIPNEAEFPYTIRIVSEALESNGSTSMASTCASSLALMDAGVPIKKPVAGIAMGLASIGDDYVILTDIQGLEDAFGEMDFKVAGTYDGITALQLDVKNYGLTMQQIEKTLVQAKTARLFLLNKMTECIPESRKSLSQHAPSIFTIMINPEKIKDVIGPGGKIINKIIKETGAKIDIENDGRVFVAAIDKDMGFLAKKMILDLTTDPEVGQIYNGKVTKIMNFGAFVEILPGKEGLIHISKLAAHHVNRVEDEVNLADEIKVKLYEIDSMGRLNLIRADLEYEPSDNDTRKRKPTRHYSKH